MQTQQHDNKRGAWPVMLTPFKRDGALDLDGLDRLTDWYLQHGAAGLFANCLSSEMYQLSPDERLTIVQRVVQRVKGRVPVVAAATFARDVEADAAFIRRMADLGIEAAVVITSMLAQPFEDQTVWRDRMHRLMELSDPVPLGLYESPVPYKRLVPPELLAQLASTGRFKVMKDTSCAMALIQQKIDAARGTPLQWWNAHVPTLLDSLRAGGAGVSTTGTNVFPQLHAWLCEHFDDEPANAARVQATLTALQPGVMPTMGYPLSAKWLLHRAGVGIEPVTRVPAEPIHPDHHGRILTSMWQLARETCQSLGLPADRT